MSKLIARARRGSFFSPLLAALWLPYFVLQCVHCADISSVLFGCEFTEAVAAIEAESVTHEPDCHSAPGTSSAAEDECCDCGGRQLVVASASPDLTPSTLSVLDVPVGAYLPAVVDALATHPEPTVDATGPPVHLRLRRLLI